MEMARRTFHFVPVFACFRQATGSCLLASLFREKQVHNKIYGL
jgi:hypothetical protein